MNALSVDLDIITVSEIDDDIMISEGISHFKGFNCNWLVVGSLFQGQAISESNQSVDLKFSFALFPGSDGEESANKVSINGKELVAAVSSINSTEIEETGLGEIVPILFFDCMINKAVDIVFVPVSFDGKYFHLADFSFCLEHSVVGKDTGSEEKCQK